VHYKENEENASENMTKREIYDTLGLTDDNHNPIHI
jgi:hypothetical protein